MTVTLRQYQQEAVSAVLATNVGQVILPTGTGKSTIQAAVIETMIRANGGGFGVYVILTPRIMLTNQLMSTVAGHLVKSGIMARAVTVHSGKATKFYDDDTVDEYTRYMVANLQNDAVINSDAVSLRIKEARASNLPMLVCCTYDSVNVLTSALKNTKVRANQIHCDEAHYLIEEGFNLNVANLKQHTDRIHFFTATQRIFFTAEGTVGELSSAKQVRIGNGMNNVDYYGRVIYHKTPREMIDAGYMVRPRIHHEIAPSTASWSVVIRDAFIEHQKNVSYDAKMLVCCDGTATVEEISKNTAFVAWAVENGITVFSTTSKFGNWINNEEVSRDEFLNCLRKHDSKAVILHINILTEGIDVPDITGVAFIRNMGLARFLQALGRAARVVGADIGKSVDDFKNTWQKPYAWAIIVDRNDADKTEQLKKYIHQMRDVGFEALEQTMVAYDRGVGETAHFDSLNKGDRKGSTTFSQHFQIIHDIERSRIADIVATAKTFDEILDEVF